VQRSYVAKTTINFVDFEFYIRPGDLLVHDTANHNRLTIYRNGQIAKVGKLGSLGIVAFIKNLFIEEVIVATTAAVVVDEPIILPSVIVAPTTAVDNRKGFSSKRDKAPEVPIEEAITEEDKAE
jgi:hypothetical protein